MNLERILQILLMKSALLYCLVLVMVLAGCHRKTVPASTRTATANSTGNNNEVKPLLSPEEAAGGTVAPSTAPAVTKAIIVVDAKGNFAVSQKDLPPDAAALNNANARAYTPAETKNLAYRFGKIPPRILYVPAALRKTTSRGTYYVLQKKYWYWKKSDGYFYLDENYYR